MNEIDAFVLVDTANCTSNLCNLLYLRAWPLNDQQPLRWYLHVPKILLMERDTYACATYWLLVVLDGENSGVHCLFLHFTYWHVVLILARVKMKQFNKYFDRFHNKLLAVYILWNCIVWWLIFLPLLVWNKLYVEQVCSWWNMNKTDLLITNICHILYL